MKLLKYLKVAWNNLFYQYRRRPHPTPDLNDSWVEEWLEIRFGLFSNKIVRVVSFERSGHVHVCRFGVGPTIFYIEDQLTDHIKKEHFEMMYSLHIDKEIIHD